MIESSEPLTSLYYDTMRERMFEVLRWQTGQLPFVRTQEELDLLKETDNNAYYRNRFFEPLYKHVLAMQTELNRLIQSAAGIGAEVDLSRCKLIAWVHDMGEPAAGQRNAPGFTQVSLNPNRNPYGFFYHNPGEETKVFYLDLPFGISNPEERRCKKEHEYSSFLASINHDVQNGLIDQAQAAQIITYFEEYEEVVDDEGLIRPTATTEGVFVKYLDRYVGSLVGLTGPFRSDLHDNTEAPVQFHTDVRSTLTDTFKFYRALESRLTSNLAKNDLKTHFSYLLEQFTEAGYGNEVGNLW